MHRKPELRIGCSPERLSPLHSPASDIPSIVHAFKPEGLGSLIGVPQCSREIRSACRDSQHSATGGGDLPIHSRRSGMKDLRADGFRLCQT